MQSMSDLFDKEVPIEWLATAWGAIHASRDLDIQIVTKRLTVIEKRLAAFADHPWAARWPQHAGLIISVVNQDEADRDIPRLLELKKKLGIPWVGLSMEPLLGPVDLRWIAEPDEEKDGVIDALLGCNWIDGTIYDRGEEFRPARPGHQDRVMRRWVCSPENDILANRKIDWVIVGGESGPGARPMANDWAQAIVDQCQAASVSVFVKQLSNGGPKPIKDIELFPEGLRVRQWPVVEERKG
jgi:protein gp37